jgi:hypothetical protein
VTQAEQFHAEVPETIRGLCYALTDFVEKATGFRPDYTPLTLPIVDHYLTLARKQIEGRPEVVDLTAQAVGAYFGEVVRRALTGFWHLPSPNFNDWSLMGQAAFVSFNPIGVGYEVLHKSSEYAGPSPQIKVAREDGELVAARLAALPPEREDSYYSLSVRFEALELVFECTRAQAEARGYTDMFYSAEDYLHSSLLGLPST